LDFNHNSGWERRGRDLICRWAVIWSEPSQEKLVGVVAGYVGGGAYALEEFVCLLSNGALLHCFSDLDDKVTGREIDFFEDMAKEDLKISAATHDELASWINFDEWNNGDRLILANAREGDLVEVEKGLYARTGPWSGALSEVLSLHGITARPAA